MLCWIDHVWSSKQCVCCACDPNERLSAPSICFGASLWYVICQMVYFGILSLKVYSSGSVLKVTSHIRSWLRMSSSTVDSSNPSFETSSNAFSRCRKIVAVRDLHPFLRADIGSAVCISVAMASIIPTPLFKP